MPSILYVECEEYLLLYEYVQGNPFGGLEYDEEVTSELTLDDPVYIQFVEMLAELLDFGDDFTPSHAPYCIIDERLNLAEQFGSPVRAFQAALNVLYTAPPVPLECCFMGVEILHGVETYYEEPSSGLHLVDWSQVVNYFIDTIYESLDIVMEPWDGRLDWIIKFNFTAADLINMRHDVFQAYSFNCYALDMYGVFSHLRFGYGSYAHSQARFETFAQNAIGKTVDEYLSVDDEQTAVNWAVTCTLRDTFFAIDDLFVLRGYDLALNSDLSLTVSVSTIYNMLHVVSEALGLEDLALSPTQRFQIVAETIKFASFSKIVAFYSEAIGSELIIDEETGEVRIGYEAVDSSLDVNDAHTLLAIYDAFAADGMGFIEEVYGGNG